MAKLMITEYRLHAPACEEYDPRTAQVGQKVARAITTALPQTTVEPIGSTSVPGCAGKGIVDLMVVYPDGELEAVKESLQALGFQRQTVGHIHPESRPMRVGALKYNGCTFRLHVHVISASSEEVTRLRAFRERLLAHPELVAEYVERKRAILAAGVQDPGVYSEMKSAFIETVLAEAEAS